MTVGGLGFLTAATLSDGAWSGGAAAALAGIAISFYRFVWKPQQDRMDAFVARKEATLESEVEDLKAELSDVKAEVRELKREIEQCHQERRDEQEDNAKLRVAIINAGLQIPD